MLDQISDTELSQAYLGTLAGPQLPKEPCPSAEELWMACTLELDQERRKEIIDHCVSCKVCAQAMMATRELVILSEQETALQGNSVEAEASEKSQAELSVIELGAFQERADSQSHCGDRTNDGTEETGKLIRSSRWNKKWRGFAAGSAGLAVAAGLAFMVTTKPERSEGSAWRGQDEASASRVQSEAFSYNDGVFSWPSSPGVDYFEVQITNATGQAVCRQAVRKSRYRLDAERCPGFTAVGSFFWKVRTVLKDGAVRDSEFFAVERE